MTAPHPEVVRRGSRAPSTQRHRRTARDLRQRARRREVHRLAVQSVLRRRSLNSAIRYGRGAKESDSRWLSGHISIAGRTRGSPLLRPGCASSPQSVVCRVEEPAADHGGMGSFHPIAFAGVDGIGHDSMDRLGRPSGALRRPYFVSVEPPRDPTGRRSVPGEVEDASDDRDQLRERGEDSSLRLESEWDAAMDMPAGAIRCAGRETLSRSRLLD